MINIIPVMDTKICKSLFEQVRPSAFSASRYNTAFACIILASKFDFFWNTIKDNELAVCAILAKNMIIMDSGLDNITVYIKPDKNREFNPHNISSTKVKFFNPITEKFIPYSEWQYL